MNKKIFVVALVYMFLCIEVKADCSYTEVAKMKKLVNNTNISYSQSYDGVNEMYFDVTINNITSDMYFIDSSTKKTYTYADSVDGEIVIEKYNINYTYGGTYNFYSANGNCQGKKLGAKYYKFPILNIFYRDQLCVGFENISLCQKWTNKRYTRDEFEKKIEEYKESIGQGQSTSITKAFFDSIIEFIVKYYYYVLGVIVVVFASIAIYKRKDDAL